MWGDVRWRAVAGGAAIVALALAASSRAEPPPVAQAPPPPRDGLAAKPAVPGTLGVKTRPLPKAGATGARFRRALRPPAVSPAPGAAPAAPAAPSIVKVQGDRLTVQLSDVPIDEVLRRIAEPSKADISGAVTTPRNVTADFADVPLQDGLARLLGEQNFLLTYRVDGGLKRLTLMGGSTDAPVETRVVKTTPATPQQTPGDLLQRRIPVRGKLKGFLGEETATVQQLMDIALRQDDSGLRFEAMTVGLNALDTQADLRAAVVRSLTGPNELLEGILRSVPQERAMEILNHLTGSRIPELRTRGLELSRRLHEEQAQADER